MYNLGKPWPNIACLKPSPWDVHDQKTSEKAQNSNHTPLLQICFFNAAVGKALTTVFAGFAATFTSLPKMFLTPAFVAGFTLVLMRHKPGSANTPFFFTSLVAISTRLLSTFEQVLVLISSVAMAFNKAPLVMALFAPAFMDFMAGAILFERIWSEGGDLSK